MPSRESPAQRVVEGQSRDGQHPCASQGAEERGLMLSSKLLIILGKHLHRSHPFCPPQKKQT